MVRMLQIEESIPHKAKQAVLTAVLKYDYLGTYFDPLNKAEEFRVLVKMWFQRLVAVLQQQMRAAFWPDKPRQARGIGTKPTHCNLQLSALKVH